MNDPLAIREWILKAHTPIWTGDANRNGDRLVLSGVLGSIRWWFEVVVRGLSGAACDPSFEDRGNPNGSRCPERSVKRATNAGHHCVVCELFGCTGWSRKFRFQVLDKNGKPFRSGIKADDTFNLRFVPLRPVRAEEWELLDVTLRLIAHYGSLGGKTVLKPSDESGRGHLPHHQDYGIVEITARAVANVDGRKLLDYVRAGHWRSMNRGDFAWASLASFWSVNGKYLARQSNTTSTFNRVIDRPEPKSQAASNSGWLAGWQRESKKVLSFKNPQRTFGFVKPGIIDFGKMKKRLGTVWLDLNEGDFVTGDEVLKSLLNS